jgi:hypothetical protein
MGRTKKIYGVKMKNVVCPRLSLTGNGVGKFPGYSATLRAESKLFFLCFPDDIK